MMKFAAEATNPLVVILKPPLELLVSDKMKTFLRLKR